jgi:protein-histidine pros-kinase
MKLSLTVKTNLVLVPTLLILLAVSLTVVRRIADQTALEETDQTARLMMSAAQATFDYTVEQIKPTLEAKYDFLVQSVSSYAATETIGRVERQFHDYRYHVAALNPTNKRDLADAWEANAIQVLARDGAPSEFKDVRETDKGRFAVIAVPIRITNAACLSCHSVPEAAPTTMVETYGRDNGFGWKLNEVIGAQVVSVPMSVAQKRADSLFKGVFVVLVTAFAAIWLIANLVMYFVVARRLGRLAQLAERVSKGDIDLTGMSAMSATGGDEVASLTRAFERMRVSLSLAMQAIRS